jgi:hypothetical protein
MGEDHPYERGSNVPASDEAAIMIEAKTTSSPTHGGWQDDASARNSGQAVAAASTDWST